jgi:hypothetical protein
MKIDSGLSGSYYPNRTAVERKQEDAPQREAPAVMRLPGALTGSSTLLSSSLANALWVMEAGDADSTSGQAAPVSENRVHDLYQEFA